ncbi:uncharacterized protein LOC125242762 [Leguminivora glycinivorella]|uniref:uncharacterized protein LOC125242762 n=1 Tax=Leguminivora glycinivorella TaxID=1035111 RepID=UPI00200E27F5|nr:uncharacterized protein LOC125242762 [Leguminivora glycinivorella]
MCTNEQLIRVLEETAKLLRKTESNLKKCPKQRLTKGYLESRLQCIETYWKTFTSTHTQLVQNTTIQERGEMQYFLKEEYYIVEELYLCLQGDIKDALAAAAPTHVQGTSSLDVSMFEAVQHHVKLPAIVLPVFSNNYEEWPTFHDLFTSLVHNNTSLSKVQKLHYLKSSIAGEAAALLKHVTITEQNYELAWETLKQRYGNKRLIVNSLLKRLFNQKKSTTQTSSQIKNVLDTTTQCLNDLQNLQVKVNEWDPFIIYLVVNRLDNETHKDWEEHAYNLNADQLPKWNDLKKYLESKFRTLELVNPVTATIPKETKSIKEKSYHVSTSTKSCVLCRGEHTLCHCEDFTKMSPVERIDYVKKTNLCFNCLLPGHSASRCRLSFTCRICKKRHHTMIHQAQNTESVKTQAHHSHLTHEEEDPQNNEEVEEVEISCNFTCNKSKGLLATAMISIKDDEGHVTPLRCLIDPGSESSFLSERVAQALRVKRSPVKGIVTGVGDLQVKINSVTHVQVLSNQDDSFQLDVKAYIMPSKLTSQLPSRKIKYDPQVWSHLQGLTLADPKFHQPGRVDMLLGVKVYAQILEGRVKKGPPGTPCAQETSLGWIIFGDVEDTADTLQENIVVMHHHVNVDDMVKAFWEIDTTDTKKSLTSEEEKDETIYKETHTRDEEGRHIGSSLFKNEELLSPKRQTRDIARLRLKQHERRFKRDANLKNANVKAIEEYPKLNYIEEEEKVNKEAVYLPFHEVIKEEKETRKTRNAFNASKGSNVVSLNNGLLVGPHLQDDMRNLVMKWLEQISEATCLPTSKMHAWMDAILVLSWLYEDPARWQPFKRNRVIAIQGITSNQWYHACTTENLPDIVSRGIPLSELKSCSFCCQGPQWLKHKNTQLEHRTIEETVLEMREVTMQVNLNIYENIEALPEKFDEHDTLPDLLKSIVYTRRFLTYLKEKNTNTEKARKRVSTKNKLGTLNPYLDATEILRVGGGLCHSELDEERKHRIILGKCHFTYFIMHCNGGVFGGG